MVKYEELYKLTKDLTVLFVEDDPSFQKETCEVLDYFFNKVDLADNGQDGLDKYLSYFNEYSKYYDIVITDINMPKMDGIELTKNIYKYNKKQSIIVISAHDESHYLIELINLGVEQFLMKPIEYDNVLSILNKIANNVIEQSKSEIKSDIIEFTNDYSWDINKFVLYHYKTEIKLTKRENLLMQLLVKNGNKISTNQEILHTLWDSTVESTSEDALLPIISRFRKKLPKDLIENVYGVGYKLNI